jgi:hypothetical protein
MNVLFPGPDAVNSFAPVKNKNHTYMKYAITRTIILFLFILTTFYCYGARVMDYFAIYETWKLVDAKDFPGLHQFQSVRIISLFVIPAAVMTLLNIAAFLLPAPYVSRKWIGVSLLVYAFDWIFSFTTQIPIQFKLHHVKDVELLDELLRTNWWRFTADSLHFLMICVVFGKLLQRLQQLTIK